MSRFLKLLRGSAQSTTMKGNGLIGIIFAALQGSEWGQQAEVATVFTAVTILFNLFQRVRTNKSLDQKADEAAAKN